MAQNEFLPIKVVLPSAKDYAPPPPARAIPKFFCDVTDDVRQRLRGEVERATASLALSFTTRPDVPAVAKVKLREEAKAKSYRPSTIFNESTCPVIGTTSTGDLLVSATPKGLAAVSGQISVATAKKEVAHISTLVGVEAFSATDALRGKSADQLVAPPRKGAKVPVVACTLFDHQNARANAAIKAAFEQIVAAEKVETVKPIRYSESLVVYAMTGVTQAAVVAIASLARSVYTDPEYSLVRTAARVTGRVNAGTFPAPGTGRYGTVGMIDSGTDPNNPHLQAWVSDRWDWVPRELQNNDHGSFVGGLLVHSRLLNHGDASFPGGSCRIVDVVALDREGSINETDLILVLDGALAKFPHVRVWNLSLALSHPCKDNEFSKLAVALDHRALKHSVNFVLAAGNYLQSPYRSWPPEAGLGDDDRVSPPGDCVRGITVGSIAHRDTPASRVRVGHPSPFSKRGPAAGFLLKPELVHFGGNCDGIGQCVQTGVISVDAKGNIAENVGTSFATPLVSNIAGGMWDELSVDASAANPDLVKALLVHSAFLRRVPTNLAEMRYFGTGVPADVEEIVRCSQSSATVVLPVEVTDNPQFVKAPFPIVEALEVDGLLQGEVFITLVHESPLDPEFGPEYCRSDVTVSLGTPKSDSEGKLTNHRQVPLVGSGVDHGPEGELVKRGFKWSPLKLYYRKFSRVAAGMDWRLLVDRLDRAEKASRAKQKAVVVMTVRARFPEQSVYDRVATFIREQGWVAQDLQVRSRARVRAG